MVNNNILVLGSTGNLGSYLTLNLKKYFNKIYTYNRKKDGIFNEKKLEDIISKYEIKIIINTIAQTNLEVCEKQFEKAINDNVLTSLILINVLNKLKNKIKVIHISTDNFYNNKRYSSENDKISLLNNYSITKYFSEQIISQYRNSIILRTNFFIDKNSGLISYIFNNLKNCNKIDLYSNIFFTPVHVSSICEAISITINFFKPGIYNLGCKNKYSKYDFGLKLIEIYKINNILNINKSEYRNLKILRPFDMSMSSKKFEKTFNYKVNSFDKELSKIVI